MSAMAQAASLLKPDEAVDLGGEYLDVLGERDALGPHLMQRAFRSKLVPKTHWRVASARFFLGLFGPREERERRIVLEMMRVGEGDQAIDIGCGTGNYARDLARAVGEGLTVGLDASEPMIAAAAARSDQENLTYLRGDACALPFADESFDVACSVGVFHLLEKPHLALAEMTRVLTPGGRLVVAAMCARKESRRGSRIGLTAFGKDELTSPLRERGFERIEQKLIGRAQFVSAQKPSQGVGDGR